MQDLINIEATEELCEALNAAIAQLNLAAHQRIKNSHEQNLLFKHRDELKLLHAGICTNAAYRRHRAARSSDPAS